MKLKGKRIAYIYSAIAVIVIIAILLTYLFLFTKTEDVLYTHYDSIVYHLRNDGNYSIELSLNYDKIDEEITIPNYIRGRKVTEIGMMCNPLIKKLNISANIEYVYNPTSKGSVNFVTYTVHKDNAFFEAKDGILYTKGIRRLIDIPHGYVAEKLIIPETVESIGQMSLHCVEVKTIIFPSALEEISDLTFLFCSTGKEIVFTCKSPPRLFCEDVHSSGHIAKENRLVIPEGVEIKFYVPAESLEVYKMADGWKDFADRIFAIEE